jgi:hypothetical protein
MKTTLVFIEKKTLIFAFSVVARIIENHKKNNIKAFTTKSFHFDPKLDILQQKNT